MTAVFDSANRGDLCGPCECLCLSDGNYGWMCNRKNGRVFESVMWPRVRWSARVSEGVILYQLNVLAVFWRIILFNEVRSLTDGHTRARGALARAKKSQPLNRWRHYQREYAISVRTTWMESKSVPMLCEMLSHRVINCDCAGTTNLYGLPESMTFSRAHYFWSCKIILYERSNETWSFSFELIKSRC